MKKITIFLAFTFFNCCILYSQAWLPLGKGIPVSIGMQVFAIDSINGKLYVGGLFDSAGGKPAHNIAVWDGSTWSTLGSGANSKIAAIIEYNGNVCVAGCFDTIGGLPINGVAQWNGSSWSGFGKGVNACPVALAVYNGNLIAGGLFDSAGGVFANHVAQWDGTKWDSLGSGINGFVNVLITYGSGLVAGGSFNRAGGIVCNSIGLWDGGSWSSIMQLGSQYNVNAFAVDNNYNFYVSGQFGGAIMGYSGTYFPMGTVSGAVFAILPYNGDIIAGGWYNRINGNPVRNIAGWNHHTWDTLSWGVNVVVNALATYNGNLYAGGNFDTAGIVRANGIAEWCATCPDAINEVSQKSGGVTVYPNPSNGKFTIQSSVASSQKSVVEIYNVLGEKTYSTPFTIHNSTFTIDISANPAGIYLYRVIAQDGTPVASGKLIMDK